MVDCNSLNNNIKLLIVSIMMIILVISFLFILVLNIINYILFSIYCINDIILEYTSEDPENIILEDLYKYRLLKYVINLSYLSKNNSYNVKYDYDKNSSDLYIHNVIVYYNYIVKLLLLIIILLFIGFIYNMFNLLITVVNNHFCKKNDTCVNIFTEIYNNHSYIYYIILIIFFYIYLHSYVYTYVFNKSIYKDLYDIYEGDKGNYQKSDFVLSDTISLLNNTSESKSIEEENIVIFIDNLKNFSYKKLYFDNILYENSDDTNDKFKKLIDYGLTNNYKFIIPSNIINHNKINILLKDICDINSDNDTSQNILGYKIFIYLIYHYVISHNKEDPFIIHKLNNIYLNIYDNISKKHIDNYNKKALNKHEKETDDKEIQKEKETQDKEIQKEKETETETEKSSFSDVYYIFGTKPPPPDKISSNNKDFTIDLINNIDNLDIKNMYNDIRCSYTIKLLLPENTKATELSETLHNNAKLLVDYINKYLQGEKEKTKTDKFDKIINILSYDNKGNDKNYGHLQNTIKDKIKEFADTFHDYYLENEAKRIINFNLYKINFYLAIEMLQTIIFILIVLIILYKSNEYPFIEKYINIVISYALLIIDEVIYAILGIYFV